jgi:hypothetical protein
MWGLSRRLPFELVGHLTAVKVMVLGAAQANVTSLKDVDLESRSSSSDVDSNRRYFLDDSASIAATVPIPVTTSHFLLLVPWH